MSPRSRAQPSITARYAYAAIAFIRHRQIEPFSGFITSHQRGRESPKRHEHRLSATEAASPPLGKPLIYATTHTRHACCAATPDGRRRPARLCRHAIFIDVRNITTNISTARLHSRASLFIISQASYVGLSRKMTGMTMPPYAATNACPLIGPIRFQAIFLDLHKHDEALMSPARLPPTYSIGASNVRLPHRHIATILLNHREALIIVSASPRISLRYRNAARCSLPRDQA